MYKEFSNFWNKKWGAPTLIENNVFALNVEKYCFWENKKLLDIGCWTGRDSLYFSGKGFQVDAFDFSENAIEALKKFSQEKWLSLNTHLWNTLEYDFKENEYDIIYACNSLHYFNTVNTNIIIEKLKKSLKKGWYIFIRVKSIDDTDFGKWEKIAENFYKNGWDLKYYFEIDFMKKLFSDFEILELQALQDTHNKIYGWTTINWFIDLVAKK